MLLDVKKNFTKLKKSGLSSQQLTILSISSTGRANSASSDVIRSPSLLPTLPAQDVSSCSNSLHLTSLSSLYAKLHHHLIQLNLLQSYHWKRRWRESQIQIALQVLVCVGVLVFPSFGGLMNHSGGRGESTVHSFMFGHCQYFSFFGKYSFCVFYGKYTFKFWTLLYPTQ